MEDRQGQVKTALVVAGPAGYHCKHGTLPIILFKYLNLKSSQHHERALNTL